VGPAILGSSNVSDDGKNDNYTTTSSIVFQIGKEGIGYLLIADKLGGFNGQIFSAPVCNAGAYGGTAYAAPYLYVPCRDGLVSLYLQPYSSFTVRWRGPVFQSGPPIVAGGLVWTIDLDNGNLYAFDQSTGKILFQKNLGDVTHFSTSSSAHGQIFVPASNRILSFSIK
jgi:outer membrane protein assembly factor BamB